MSPSSPAGSSSSSLPSSNVSLGIPDGGIPAGHGDLNTPNISRIGGYATLPIPQPLPAINCGVCHQPIPLLMQVHCPPDGGVNDRTVYIFACGRKRCQRREGCVRAWRGSRRNEKYVKEVEDNRREREEEERRQRELQRINPFTMNGDAQPTASALFGGAHAFGASANPFATPARPAEVPNIANLSLAEPETDAVPAPVSSTHTPPHPAYQPPQYVDTLWEFLPEPEEMDLDGGDDEEDESIRAEWKDERFESLFPRGVDPVFERFVRRINSALADGHKEGHKQVLRYELGGVPMPYSSKSPLTRKLFPTLPQQKPDDDEPSFEEHYDPSSVTACPRCKGPRVFEVQLLPSLISILRPETMSTDGEAPKGKGKKRQSEAERKKELLRLAKGADPDDPSDIDNDGMEWGSILVFGCENDCVGFGEEWVGVEWETILSA